MSRYLIVAHETATNPTLVERVKQLTAEDPSAEFALLVPATPVPRLLLRRAGKERAETVARRRAQEAQAAFAEAGVQLAATGVGAPSPLDAVADELRDHPGYDGFVVSTLPAEHSRWLEMDLPGELQRRHELPVIHVELTPTELSFWQRRAGWGRV
jgi:GABA permease